MRAALPIVAALGLGLASCANPSVGLNTAQVDTDKALIVADSAYHAAAVVAVVGIDNGTFKGATAATIKADSAKAADALHKAYQVRTSASVAAAIAAIALFTQATGAK